MDELIGRLAAKAGVDDAITAKSIGIIPGFLRREGFSHNVQALIDRIPCRGTGRTVAPELFRFDRDKIGTDETSRIIARTPDLGQIA